MNFADFRNGCAAVTLKAEKKLAGAAWPANGQLTFTLTGSNDAPMPAVTTATLSAAGEVYFGPIYYFPADAGKTYSYTISEDGFGTGWSGPGSVTATVKVTANNDNTLNAEVAYSPEDAAITNTYTATGSATLKAAKAVAGAGWPTDGTITFTLSGTGGTLPTEKTVTLTGPGTATFGAITYNESDAGKTYTYTITEDGFGTGWTGSGNITATVVVTDNGDGTLGTTVTYSPTNDTITNTYKATGSATLKAAKAVAGAAWPADGTITFTLSGTGGTLPDDIEATLTAPGTATFGAITYDESDAGKTYTYTISENSSFGDGWSGSGDITATVSVTDNGNGTLSTDVTYNPTSDTITNTYSTTPITVSIPVRKVMEGGDENWDWVYGITVAAKDKNSPDPAETTGTISNLNTPKQTIEIGQITFENPGVYEYLVSEDEGHEEFFDYGIAGVLNDSENPKAVTITVTDNGDGTLSAEIEPKTVVFTNRYVTKKITVDKVWDDDGDRDGVRPQEIRIQLTGTVGDDVVYSDGIYFDPVYGEYIDEAGNVQREEVTVPVYANGKDEIVYTVSEDELPEGYDVNIESDASGKTAEEDVTFTVTNSHETIRTEVKVEKIWDDQDDKDGLRPRSVTVNLLANGEKVESGTVSPDEEGGWSYTFENLPAYSGGKEIKYTVTEEKVAGYETEIDGFRITNKHTPKKPEPEPDPGPALDYKFTFTKLWTGGHEDSIDWTLYDHNGTVVHKKFNKKIVSETEWRYEAWFATGEDYYIIENVPQGYHVRYRNTGAHKDDMDRCYNGGTIINYKVPKTGDIGRPGLWIALTAVGAVLLGGLVLVRYRGKKNKP